MTALQTSGTEQVWLMPVFTPKPGRESALRVALEALQKVSRKDTGCIEYIVFADAGRFVLIEGWERQADLDAHNDQAHVLEFVKLTQSLLAEPFTVTPITPVG
jgi:quinol monooxygenase YgiN